jgi:hypothetical protein
MKARLSTCPSCAHAKRTGGEQHAEVPAYGGCREHAGKKLQGCHDAFELLPLSQRLLPSLFQDVCVIALNACNAWERATVVVHDPTIVLDALDVLANDVKHLLDRVH